MDYEYFTTFWQDFDVAENYGERAIKDTAKRAFDEWKDDVKYLTELVMNRMSELYDDMYYEYYDKALDYLEEKGNEDDISYFIRTLD